MFDLLTPGEFPDEFSYPDSFVRVVDLGLIDLEPWQILEGPRLRERFRGLAARFPGRALIPFAVRQDNDDVACWDLASDAEMVVVIHDFAKPGWEARAQYSDFYAWLRRAIEDLIDFE